MRAYTILRNDDRYPGSASELPNVISLPHATLEQARCLAERLTNWYAGQDYMFYVVGEDEQ